MNKVYEGKAKIIYATENEDIFIQRYKDDITAFNNQKKDSMNGKGIVNCKISTFLFNKLAENNIPTHFIRQISENEQEIKRLSIVPLEVIVRKVATGSFSKRYGITNGTILKKHLVEFCLKDDSLGDPFISIDAIEILDIASNKEIIYIKNIAVKVFEIINELLIKNNFKLVDFKLEFGRDKNNQIILADEISPDSMRIWDEQGNSFDKDIYRKTGENPVSFYNKIAQTLGV